MGISRREFSVGLAGAAAFVGVRGRAAFAAAGPAPSVIGGVIVGVQSYTFRSFDFDRMIASLGSIGITSLELWGDGKAHPLHPVRNTEADFRAVRAKLDAAGITVNAYCTNFPVDATREHVEKAFVGCALLGAKVLTSSTEKGILPLLDEMAQAHKISVGLHNHWLGDSWFKGDKSQNFEGPADFAETLKGSPYLGINLDIGHFSAAGLDPVAYFKEHHARIFSLHVKDRGADAEHSGKRFGEGATPIKAVLLAAKAVKFPHGVNIEWEMDEHDPTEGVRDAFGYVRRVLG